MLLRSTLSALLTEMAICKQSQFLTASSRYYDQRVRFGGKTGETVIVLIAHMAEEGGSRRLALDLILMEPGECREGYPESPVG